MLLYWCSQAWQSKLVLSWSSLFREIFNNPSRYLPCIWNCNSKEFDFYIDTVQSVQILNDGIVRVAIFSIKPKRSTSLWDEKYRWCPLSCDSLNNISIQLLWRFSFINFSALNWARYISAQNEQLFWIRSIRCSTVSIHPSFCFFNHLTAILAQVSTLLAAVDTLEFPTSWTRSEFKSFSDAVVIICISVRQRQLLTLSGESLAILCFLHEIFKYFKHFSCCFVWGQQ